MLKKTKIRLISIFATAFAALSVFAIGLGQTANRVYAQSGEIFEMENGASLKISEDGGIRFRVKMDEEQMLYITQNDDVSLHFLVAPHEFYNAVPYANGTFDYYNGLSKKKVINVDESKIYEEDGCYWANGCVTNINVANRYLDYTFLAYTYDAYTNVTDYAGVNIGGEVIQETNESDYKLGNVRGNLVDLLSQAVVYDGDDANYADSVFNCSAYSDWFGLDEYPIQINNLAMYNGLVNKVNAGEDFSKYNISILDTIPMDGREELSEGKSLDTSTSHMVKFLNDDGSLYKKFIVDDGETLAVPKNPTKAASAQYAYTFNGWDVDGDGMADTVETNVQKSVTYTALYTATTNQYKVTFDAQGGTGGLQSATVDYGTSLSEFYKMKYIPADSGFVFDSWRYNGEKIDKNATVTGDMELVAYYKRVDGTAVAESPINGDFYQAFVALPVDEEVGESVVVTMDIYLTGKIVSNGVDTTDEYYNQWATSSIRWVDTVWSEGGEVNGYGTAVSFDTLRNNTGKWVTVSFVAKVRNFPVLKTGTGWADVEMNAGNAVYLYAANFKSAASFNYRNVKITGTEIMPTGTQKTNPDQFYQSAAGLPTEYAAGTFVKVAMDVYVTGSTNEYSYISWVDTVWGDNAVNKETKIATYELMSANAGEWMHLEFYATVRDFDALRRDANYPTIDVSGAGTGVFIMAANFLSADTFIYRNVIISAEEDVVGLATPAGTQKTSNANGYYQAFTAIPTEYEEGTSVIVEMDVYVTGAYDQYSGGIKWVDTVYSTEGGEVNSAPTIVSIATMDENVGKWIHVSFTATVRNFSVLRANPNYATMDTSSYGNAVYLFGKDFKSAASFNYANVTIVEAPLSMPTGTQKTTPDKYYQSVVGLPTNLPAGTAVEVEMDIFVTGSFDEYSYISWVDTVWTTAGGEINNAPAIPNFEKGNLTAGQWIHVAFEATVRDYDVLRMGTNYPTMDVSSAGTGVFLVAANFLSDDSFEYKNVTMKEIGSVPEGTKKSNGYYQAYVGLPTEYEVGTTVLVNMDIYVTGTVDTAYSATNIKWIDTVYSNNAPNGAPTIVNNATLQQIVGQWYHVEFEATVRNFSSLRGDANFSEMDVSAYGNAVYIIAYQFKSASSFMYKNISVRLPGEEEPEVPEIPEEPEIPVIEGTAMPEGTQKTTPDQFYQAAVGFSTNLAAGTLVKVEMDVYVTGSTNEYSYISWVDSVWGDNAVNKENKIATYDLMNANAGKWMHLEFYAFVRDFDALRRDANYPAIDVSSAGTGVFIMAANFTSSSTFNYMNVVISADEKAVGVAMPAGTEKTSGANGYHQAFVGLPTDYEVGAFVNVTMEIFVTGTFDSYSSINWVNTVYSNNGAEKAPAIVNYDTMNANVGEWITVSFDAYVRDFDSLCLGTGYPLVDVASAGNGVFLFARQFKSDDSFNYRNVRVSAYDAAPAGTQKTANANGYYQAAVGLPVNAPVGTTVLVEMEVYVTGSYDQYSDGILWVDTVWSTEGGEVNKSTKLVDVATMDENAGQWITLSFEATVRAFGVLRSGVEYATIDTYEVGNAVFLFAKGFKSEASFAYRNVTITLDGENVSTGEFAPQEYVSNGYQIADYTIVVSDDADKSTQYAATILQAQLRKALGYDVAVVTDVEAEGNLEILLGATNRSAGSDIDYATLGEEGFVVKNVDNKLVIAGNERGVLYGVYAYLEAMGFRFYTVDVEKIPSAEEIFVPASIELNWTPTFEYREVMYEMTWDAEWAVSQRINSDFMRSDLKNNPKYGGFAGYIGGNSWMVHTLSKLLPESEYELHKDYFAEVDGKRIAKTSNGLYTQPCLTSEGAYQYILNSALAKIASDRKANIISISENDGGTYCHCAVCEASYAQYGVSGTFFRFINRIAGDIAKVYPDVWVDTLSYDMSKEAPENLKLADNVIVRVCPRMCNFCTNPNKCANLAADQQRVRDFVAICDNVYVWMYPINWGNLYAALPNYDEMRYQVNFFAQAGVKGIYAEGYSKENPEFGELKAYLMAKLLQNPTMSKAEYEYHYNDFLQGYYGDAAKYIAQYHQITEDMMDKKMETAHYDKYFTAADNFDFTWNSTTHTYDMTNINKINALWAEALSSVEEDSEEWHHVKKSMIHWTYIELYNTMDNRYKYGTTEEKAELVARNEALYNDIVYYGTIRIYDNSHDLQDITDFTKSPHKDNGNWFDQRTTFEETLGGLLGGLV